VYPPSAPGSQASYSITELAELSGVAPHTLRWYESVDLLDDVPRDAAGRRRYQERHACRLRLIADLQASGMTLAEIAEYLELTRSGDGPAGRRALQDQCRKLRQEIDELRSALKRIEHMIALESDPVLHKVH
jgi:DNA-binding transcriptional MerR regulator